MGGDILEVLEILERRNLLGGTALGVAEMALGVFTTRYPLLAEGQFTVGHFCSPSGILKADGVPSDMPRRLCSVGHYSYSRRYRQVLYLPTVIVRR